ncbi:MAG: IS3 family transposase [Leptospiraceae bacterium]|nr:IS3 family transposase [Leptospiraceae bacterium]
MDITHETLSINQQCKLLSIPHSSFYYEQATESQLNLKIMNLIDKQHTLAPVRFGQMKLVEELTNTLGIPINRKRVQRLMRLMGIEGEYQKPRITISGKNHKIYPYLLRDYAVLKPNEVWSTDITYIPMRHGYMYLTAIIDWYSRYVISWELSNTLETDFCSRALKRALNKNKPLIFNTDQGSQFTSNDFTSILANHNISISMDGKGRSLDNIFIERLWRTLKYENIYRHSFETVQELMDSLRIYFNYYNRKRIHQSLNYNTPALVYFSY